MGVVWSATHTVTLKPVALKFLIGASADLRRRFVREARAICAIRHPNVREVHDVLDLEGDAPVMVMELLTGESLASRLRRDTKLAIAESARVSLQLVSAVGAAHARGIVHRDVKPENVFLGEDGVVKVLDFGIAKMSQPDEGQSTLTESGTLLGTPRFMAPEQIFGE